MCGIAGLLNLGTDQLPDPYVAREMASMLCHRGPDDDGFYSDGHLAFGFRRLSIIDVQGGHQPVSNEDQTIWCMFNGEIYNYIELRDRLVKLGHSFQTKGDTETIVHAYEQHGLDFVHHLRGMFAIALWDKGKRRLILVRDRIGKKPLYFSVRRRQLAFASELKALLPWQGLDRSIDFKALQNYLRFLYIPSCRSIFQAVRKLLPGQMLIADMNRQGYRLKRYWGFQFGSMTGFSSDSIALELRRRLQEAVQIRLRSDVPLGTFLSGGLDSSAIMALMMRDSGSGSHLSFSASFADEEHDESEFSRLVAAHVGSSHREESASHVTDELVQQVVWHMDEPFADSSAVPTFLLCKAASRSVKVALSGDGGDELFAGYDRYRFFRWLSWLDTVPMKLREWGRDMVWSHRRWAGASPALYKRIRQIGKALDISLAAPKERPFLMNQHFEISEMQEALSIHAQSAVNHSAFDDAWELCLPTQRDLDGLERLLYIDTVIGLPDDMLTKVDRMSMANSLEVRCPLLDQKVIEYVAKIPLSLKFHLGNQKHIFKQAVSDLLPRAIVNRRKHGFSAPVGTWLRGECRDLVEDCLSHESVNRRGWLKPAFVAPIREHLLSNGNGSWPSRLSDYQVWHRGWALLVLELWARQYID